MSSILIEEKSFTYEEINTKLINASNLKSRAFHCYFEMAPYSVSFKKVNLTVEEFKKTIQKISEIYNEILEISDEIKSLEEDKKEINNFMKKLIDTYNTPADCVDSDIDDIESRNYIHESYKNKLNDFNKLIAEANEHVNNCTEIFYMTFTSQDHF